MIMCVISFISLNVPQQDGVEEKCECEPLIDTVIKTREQDKSPKFRKVLADLRDLLKQ